MEHGDVESIERATLAGVPPQAQREIGDWLVALDHGTVGRAHSAVPLRHAEGSHPIEAIERCYAGFGLATVLRIARVPAFAALAPQLSARGYAATKPTCVKVGEVRHAAALPAVAPVQLSEEVLPAWTEVFLGAGFDPVDGASRAAILQRGRDSVFARIEVDGQVAAVGAACYSHGWCGIHGMRTLPPFRGRGYAASIISTLAREAQARGIARTFLQVEEGNPARALYRRAGFREAWTYAYWAR